MSSPEAPSDLPIVEIAPLIQARRLTSAALVDACLERIDRLDPRLNAFIAVDAAGARAAAQRRDRELAADRWRGPLHGVPISIKDIIDVQGLATTAGSRVRRDHPAAADAPVVARLRAAGAVVIGKCNLHEFALGTTSEESAFGPVRHPVDPSRSPGGSSGGSAVAVVTGMSAASIGSDTGGSIRIPAAACGSVGLKPGFGELPCTGVVPLAWSLDHVGPLARTVADARLLYFALAGRPDPSLAAVAGPLAQRPLRLGVLRSYFCDRLDADVRALVDRALERLRRAGAILKEASVPHADAIASIYHLTVLSEAAAFHGPTLETRAADYTPTVRLRLEAGRYVPAEDYVRAQRGRTVLVREVDAVLDGIDALVLPTLPIAAPPLGADRVTVEDAEESVRAVMLRLTQLFNLTGHPAISIPCGLTPAGLPCGIQLAGRHGRTADLLDAAGQCERLLAVDAPLWQL